MTLIVGTPDECYDTARRDFVLKRELTVFIPNAISPNKFGVEINNKFFIVADSYRSLEIEVFNRWGERVYYSTDINESWDAKYKGVPVQEDVFFYVVRAVSLEGKQHLYSGTLTVLR